MSISSWNLSAGSASCEGSIGGQPETADEMFVSVMCVCRYALHLSTDLSCVLLVFCREAACSDGRRVVFLHQPGLSDS